MQIKNGLSSGLVIRNGPKAERYVGVLAEGYCGLHDLAYPLAQGDEICPECDYYQREVIGWREEAEADSSNEITGAEDEE